MGRLSRRAVLGAMALTILPTAARAQAGADNWPSRPVRIVVPYPPGGSTDSLTRRIAQQLTQQLGQQFVVENRAGAGGMMGTEQVSRAAPDGYLLVLGNNATHGITQLVSRRKVFDPIRDFTPITLAAAMALALAVHPSVPATTAAELGAWARSHPGKGTFGSAGLGSPHHLAGEMLSQLTGGGLVHVPYKGSGQTITDLLGGQLPIMFAALATVLPYAQAGRLRILGVAESERAKSAPSIPTIGESVPGYAMPWTWLGYFAPPNMPAALADRIHSEMVKAIHAPAVAAAINDGGMQVLTSSREEFANTIRDHMQRLGAIVKSAHISTD